MFITIELLALQMVRRFVVAQNRGQNCGQNRDSWWVTLHPTAALSRHGVVAHQVYSLPILSQADSDTEPVLYGSVSGSVLSRRRFCRFCPSDIYSPSASYARVGASLRT